MGRITWGSLIAVVTMLCLAPALQAAEIPPTASCQATMKNLMGVYFDEISGRISDKEQRLADKRLAEGLESAGCVSDSKPLLKRMPTKPFSDECVSAAPAAQKFWQPRNARLARVVRTFNRKVEKPHRARISRLAQRVKSLKERGKDHKAGRLAKKRFRLEMRFGRRVVAFSERLGTLLVKDVYASALILYEAVSLRCIDYSLWADRKSAKGPMAKVVKKNLDYIWGGMLFLSIQELESNWGGSTAAASVPLIKTE